jgi:hypothetical protein
VTSHLQRVRQRKSEILTSLLDHPVVFSAVAFVALLTVMEIGRRLALRISANGDRDLHEQIVATRDGISMLMSLLLAFTLAMVLTRYDLRKQLIVDEANAIGTTMLRAEMLAEPARSKILDLLQRYLDVRATFNEEGLHEEKLQTSLSHAKQLQDEMWEQSVAVAQQSPTAITSIRAVAQRINRFE